MRFFPPLSMSICVASSAVFLKDKVSFSLVCYICEPRMKFLCQNVDLFTLIRSAIYYRQRPKTSSLKTAPNHDIAATTLHNWDDMLYLILFPKFSYNSGANGSETGSSDHITLFHWSVVQLACYWAQRNLFFMCCSFKQGLCAAKKTRNSSSSNKRQLCLIRRAYPHHPTPSLVDYKLQMDSSL